MGIRGENADSGRKVQLQLVPLPQTQQEQLVKRLLRPNLFGKSVPISPFAHQLFFSKYPKNHLKEAFKPLVK